MEKARRPSSPLHLAALLLAPIVVVLGAYVRLSSAGLSCPDWPGCYGAAWVPDQTSLYPELPLDPARAWKEMVHRYAAATLGLLIVLSAFKAWRDGDRTERRGWLLLVTVVVAQGLLGMATVTLQLHPLVVLSHLAGGLTTLALLTWLRFRGVITPVAAPSAVVRAARLLLAVTILQIVLGGWTSANYAAPACPDFPTCQGAWWPEARWAAPEEWMSHAGSFEGGLLDLPARTAIHLTHRIGAVVTLSVALLFGLLAWREEVRLRMAGVAVALLAAAQFTLGMVNVLSQWPLPLATAHNATAALLLMAAVVANIAARATPPATAGAWAGARGQG